MWTRRKARIAALQTLFQNEFGLTDSAENLIHSFWNVISHSEMEDFMPQEEIPEEHKELINIEEIIVTHELKDIENSHYSFLVEKVLSQKEELDTMLATVSKAWNIKRFGKVEIILMRIAIIEALYCEDVPVISAIDEAIEISKYYADIDSYTFVNGVLDKILKNKAGEKETIAHK
ncbi:MAG: transcription antitermination factor NusB [Nitrospinae bacterium]|nr:transcription antitermination factor NusB [Nitrospinota bacterium]